MRILVTGGAGFIGHHLCRRLVAEGHEVTVLDDYSTGLESNLDGIPVRKIRGDVRVPFDIACDQIYHLACPASPVFYQKDGLATLRIAFEGTLNALLNAERHKARLLLASTSEVYGDPLVSPQPETYFGNVNTWGPRACYDEGKRAAEALCYEFQAQGRVDVRVARIFNTYGPGMRLDDGRVMTEFITAALAGLPLHLDAGGEQKRSFCYIDDMIRGLISLMELQVNHAPVNLGTDEEIKIRELAQMILDMTQSVSELVVTGRRADDPMQRMADMSRARLLIEWVPATPLELGVRKLIDHLKRAPVSPN